MSVTEPRSAPTRSDYGDRCDAALGARTRRPRRASERLLAHLPANPGQAPSWSSTRSGNTGVLGHRPLRPDVRDAVAEEPHPRPVLHDRNGNTGRGPAVTETRNSPISRLRGAGRNRPRSDAIRPSDRRQRSRWSVARCGRMRSRQDSRFLTAQEESSFRSPRCTSRSGSSENRARGSLGVRRPPVAVGG
jgi:hypothetical protein